MALRSGYDLDPRVRLHRALRKAGLESFRVWLPPERLVDRLVGTDRLDVAVADDRQAVERALQVALTEWIECEV
jgi:hypothetical protein